MLSHFDNLIWKTVSFTRPSPRREKKFSINFSNFCKNLQKLRQRTKIKANGLNVATICGLIFIASSFADNEYAKPESEKQPLINFPLKIRFKREGDGNNHSTPSPHIHQSHGSSSSGGTPPIGKICWCFYRRLKRWFCRGRPFLKS